MGRATRASATQAAAATRLGLRVRGAPHLLADRRPGLAMVRPLHHPPTARPLPSRPHHRYTITSFSSSPSSSRSVVVVGDAHARRGASAAVLDSSGLEYWVDGPTLLAAYRDNTLSEWCAHNNNNNDDDVMVMVVGFDGDGLACPRRLQGRSVGAGDVEGEPAQGVEHASTRAGAARPILPREVPRTPRTTTTTSLPAQRATHDTHDTCGKRTLTSSCDLDANH